LDTRSTHKRAELAIHRRLYPATDQQINENHVSHNEINNNQQRSKEMFAPRTYQEIIKYIASVIKIFGDFESLDERIGYKIMELRAAPVSFDKPGNILQHRRKIREIIKMANVEYRQKPKKNWK
jgi:hypothetical protein